MLVHVNRCVMEFCWLLNGLPRCGYTCIFPHIVARRRVNVDFCISAAEHQSKYFVLMVAHLKASVGSVLSLYKMDVLL
jgi:UDP-galactopyranose mutase